MDVLKECPFCGGKAYYTESVNGSRMAYCGCSKCGVELKAMVTYGPLENGEKKLTKDIVGIWNTRHAPPSADAERALEALDDFIEDLSFNAGKDGGERVGFYAKYLKLRESALTRFAGDGWRKIDSAPRDKLVLLSDGEHRWFDKVPSEFKEIDEWIKKLHDKKGPEGLTMYMEKTPTHWLEAGLPPKITPAPGKEG